MGVSSSTSPSDASGEEYVDHGSPGQKQKLRVNTGDILNGISKKCQGWIEIVNNIKQGELPDEAAQDYIFQELKETKMEIDILVGDLTRSIIPNVQPTYTQGKTGRQQNRKKRRKAKPSKLETEVVELQEKLKAEEDATQMYKKHNRDLTNKLANEKNLIKKTESERQELLLRLSEVTGDKLRTDNPNVADLSDPNRPIKLGEMISELYDNEWTDAFEELRRNGRSERASIRILLETFLDTFDFCYKERKKISGISDYKDTQITFLPESNKERLKRSRSTDFLSTKTRPQHYVTDIDDCCHLTNPFLFYEWLDKNAEFGVKSNDGTKEGHPKQYDEICKDFSKRLQDLKKESDKDLQKLLKEFGEQLEPLIKLAYMESRWSDGCIKSLRPYIQKCIYACWMMCIQMPPMTFADLAKCGETFCGSTYKQYTVKGPVVDYVVWPAILLHEKGPVISKGIAQGKEVRDMI